MKVELLSPVGNINMLYQAIHNGADAVYLGGKNYGARSYSENFTNDEIKTAIDYCHLYGVKIYITVNIVIFENEVDEVLEYVKFLYLNNVDAIIMQDIGMIQTVHDMFPNLEIHASTQCHNHNNEGIKLLKEIGVKRIVLDREMSLSEVKNLDTDLEKEIFIHGALCVSYSGCCLFSSLNGGRSGNRGCCVGSCRLPYKFIENDKYIATDGEYLLSTRELNTINNLESILDSDVVSLKIEGRMKSPEYVGYVTKIYRILIDKYYNKEKLEISLEEANNLKKLFNRKFTSGYLFNDKVINIESSNHLGIEIGEVIEVDDKRIKIKLTDDISMQDGIRFKKNGIGMMINKLYNKNELLIKEAKKDDIIYLDNKIGLKSKDIVLKTVDYKLNKYLEKYSLKKIGVQFDVIANLNEKLKITIKDFENHQCSVYGSTVEKAKTISTTKEDIINKLSKLGNTAFELSNANIDIDNNVFVNVSEINNIRRELVQLITEQRINNNKEVIINNKDMIEIHKSNKITLSALARNDEQIDTLIANNIDNIYTDDYELYLKYKNKTKIYYRIPRVINTFKELKNENVLVTELGGIYKYYKNNNIAVDYTLNVLNNRTIKFLKQFNVDKITISPELDSLLYKDLDVDKLEMVIYGKLELMITKYCPLKELINNCQNCKNNTNKYYLEDRYNHKFRILHKNCLTTIMHYKNLFLINNLNTYKEAGITNYRIDLLDEKQVEINEVIRQIRVQLNI